MAVPFDLNEVKLGTPVARPGTVSKPDVIDRLCVSEAPLATIVAPGGYGKTTLLACWADADPRPFAWVALDNGDDDDAVFLRHIVAAMHRVEPVRPEVLDALSGSGGTWPSRVLRVGEALAARERPLVLALDDLHTVVNPSCLDALAELFQYVPAGSQIAIASREEPALPLARWRTQGRLHELGVEDLRLDEQEAELLLEAAGVELDGSDLSHLTERTEGWPAGLYLAALSIRAGGATTRGDAERFTGEDRFISEYFRLELLSRLPAAEARVPQVHVDHGSHVWRSVRFRARDDEVDGAPREAHANEPLSRASRSAGRVVSLPPPVRSAVADGARADRAGSAARAQRQSDGVVRRERPAGGSDRLRACRGRDGRRRRPDRRSCPARLLRRPSRDPEGVAFMVRRG